SHPRTDFSESLAPGLADAGGKWQVPRHLETIGVALVLTVFTIREQLPEWPSNEPPALTIQISSYGPPREATRLPFADCLIGTARDSVEWYHCGSIGGLMLGWMPRTSCRKRTSMPRRSWSTMSATDRFRFIPGSTG